MTFPRLIVTSLSWLMRPMWQLLQMLVCRTIKRMPPCLLFAKDLGVDGRGLGLSGFDQYFEIQILTRFGISLNFNECVFCHRIGQAFDFSFKYGACLCPDHYHEDERRCHLNPNIPYLLNQFQAIDFETLEAISLKA